MTSKSIDSPATPSRRALDRLHALEGLLADFKPAVLRQKIKALELRKG